jgi:hypothetical protein
LYNLPDTIPSQYASSPVIIALLESFDACVDPQYNLEQFYQLCWNVDTAVGYGLDVWGRRVGINRNITIPSEHWLGFSGPTGESGDSFNAGIFYSGQKATLNYTMADEAYRRVILAKAASNISDGSISSINFILMEVLFPQRGNAYVRDNLNMTITYVFTFTLEPFEVALVTGNLLLPRGGGVRANAIYPT